MKNYLITLTVFAVFFTCGSKVSGQTADEIMKKYYISIGGTENWNKINTMKTTFTMVSTGGEVHGSKTVLQKKGSKKEMNIPLNGRTMTSATVITPEKGWIYNSFAAKITPMAEEKWKSSLKELNLHNPLNSYLTIGKLAYISKDTADGKKCYKIKNTDPAGAESLMYFDENTHYLVRINLKTKENGKETESLTDFKDYRKLPEGIYYPMTVIFNSAETQGVLTYTYLAVEINKPVDESMFKLAN